MDTQGVQIIPDKSKWSGALTQPYWNMACRLDPACKLFITSLWWDKYRNREPGYRNFYCLLNLIIKKPGLEICESFKKFLCFAIFFHYCYPLPPSFLTFPPYSSVPNDILILQIHHIYLFRFLTQKEWDAFAITPPTPSLNHFLPCLGDTVPTESACSGDSFLLHFTLTWRKDPGLSPQWIYEVLGDTALGGGPRGQIKDTPSTAGCYV